MSDLDSLVRAAENDFGAALTPAELENAKARFLGKAGSVTELMKALGALPAEQKKARGAQINAAKQRIESALGARRQALADLELEAQLKAEALDVTLPGRHRGMGGLHPVSRTMERIEAIFGSMGFDVADGPEIETDWMSFTALNNPENHPARSMQDTFYVDMKDAEGHWLNLRPHTSPMQVRYARAHARPSHAGWTRCPISASSRRGAPTASTATPRIRRCSTRCEGLWIGENVSFKDLKIGVHSTLSAASSRATNSNCVSGPASSRSPSRRAEIDIMFASGPLKGRWLEIAGLWPGAPAAWFATLASTRNAISALPSASGIDRLAMQRYGVNDLRLFFDGDLRFLSQFR